MTENWDVRQAIEQLSGVLLDWSHALAAYARQLEEDGFSRAEALALCIDLQRVLFGQKNAPPAD